MTALRRTVRQMHNTKHVDLAIPPQHSKQPQSVADDEAGNPIKPEHGQKRDVALSNDDISSFRPSSMLDAVSEKNSMYKDREQQDAHEFFALLITWLQEEETKRLR